MSQERVKLLFETIKEGDSLTSLGIIEVIPFPYLEMTDETGKTPLMLAVKKGMSTVIYLLLKRGVSIDVRDSQGNTALHHAVLSKRVKSVSDLVRKGANPRIPNAEGHTAIDIARNFKSQAYFDILTQAAM